MKGIPPTLVRTVTSLSFDNLLAVSPLTELFYQKVFAAASRFDRKIDRALKSCTFVTSRCPTMTSGHAKLDESFPSTLLEQAT